MPVSESVFPPLSSQTSFHDLYSTTSTAVIPSAEIPPDDVSMRSMELETTDSVSEDRAVAIRLPKGEVDPRNIFSEFQEERRLKLINALIKDDARLKFLKRDAVLFHYFCAISHLESLLAMEKDARHTKMTEDSIGKSMEDLFKKWLGSQSFGNGTSTAPKKKPRGESKAEPKENPKTKRSRRAEKTTKNRDSQKCVLTMRKQPTLESAHIVPNRLNGCSTGDSTWSVIAQFWREESVKEYQKILQPADAQGVPGTIDTETVANLMTLEVQTHRYWDSSRIGLRPVWTDDKTCIQIAFHWLPTEASSNRPRDKIRFDQCPYPPDLQKAILSSSPKNMLIFNQETSKEIRSGYVFEVTTDDPEKKPIPSFRLLELMWHLGRIKNMRAKGDEDDLSDDDDDDGPVDPIRSRDPSPDKNCGIPLSQVRPPIPPLPLVRLLVPTEEKELKRCRSADALGFAKEVIHKIGSTESLRPTGQGKLHSTRSIDSLCTKYTKCL